MKKPHPELDTTVTYFIYEIGKVAELVFYCSSIPNFDLILSYLIGTDVGSVCERITVINVSINDKMRLNRLQNACNSRHFNNL